LIPMEHGAQLPLVMVSGSENAQQKNSKLRFPIACGMAASANLFGSTIDLGAVRRR